MGYQPISSHRSHPESIAVIFDFDGVLVDSLTCHKQAWLQVGEISKEQFKQGIGSTDERFIKDVLQWSQDPQTIADIVAQKQQHLAQLMACPTLIQPSIAFIERLIEAHIPCAIGSSSNRSVINHALSTIPHIHQAFSTIVTADDVANGKPDPEIFLLAAHRLHYPPAQCIVVEDALLGLEAAKRAGMKTIALTTTFPASTLATMQPDMLVDQLASISVASLSSIIARKC